MKSKFQYKEDQNTVLHHSNIKVDKLKREDSISQKIKIYNKILTLIYNFCEIKGDALLVSVPEANNMNNTYSWDTIIF
jgi:hypothetical protein